MKVEILTIFPEIFTGFLTSSLIGKSIERGLLTVTLRDIRDYSEPPHFQVDDSPYGGGAGMVMKPEPLAKAIEAAKANYPNAKVILLSPSGLRLSHAVAQRFSQESELILICGRYEGVDQRIIDLFVDLELSIGDFVVMGGEVPAMVLLESVTRFLDNVIGNSDSVVHESFSPDATGKTMLEGPQYTRPQEFRGSAVPEVLLSGDHQSIAAWRKEMGLKKTVARRPDLLKK